MGKLSWYPSSGTGTGDWSAHSTNMWNQMIAADLTAKVAKLDIPVYFFTAYTITHVATL